MANCYTFDLKHLKDKRHPNCEIHDFTNPRPHKQAKICQNKTKISNISSSLLPYTSEKTKCMVTRLMIPSTKIVKLMAPGSEVIGPRVGPILR